MMRRHKLLAVLVLVLLAVMGNVLIGPAQGVSADPGGRTWGYGYFTNRGRQSSGFGQVLVCGFVNSSNCSNNHAGASALRFRSNDKIAFQNFVLAKYAGGGRDRVGAAFIIQTMRGHVSHNMPTASDIADWKARIANPSVTMSFGTSVSFDGWNSGYMRGFSDDAYFPESGTTSALVFKDGGNIIYKVKVNCANPIGNFVKALPPAPPADWALTSSTGIVGNRTSAYPGQTVTFIHRIVKTGDGDADYNWRICSGYYAAPTTNPSASCTGYTRATGPVTSRNNSPVLPVSESGKYFCQHIYYTPKGSAGGPEWSSGKCVRIVPVTVTCNGSTITPQRVDPYTKFNISVSASNSTGAPLASDTMTLRINGPSYNYTSPPKVVTDSTNPVTVAFNGLGPTNATGKYDFTWTYQALGGYTKTCDGSFVVANMPYFSVKGGDVVAGISMATPDGTPCTAAPHIREAGIVSWNSDGNPDFGGAGVQYAAFALSYIQDFVTGQGNNGVPPGPGRETNKLSFANVNYTAAGVSSIDSNNGMFGGMFGSVPCSDYWNNKPRTEPLAANATAVDSVADGNYLHTGNLTLNTSTLAPGRHVTIYVDGDVSITGSGITYVAGATTRAQLPSFKLIVHGVIYIDASVSLLDGVYVAVPNAGYATATNSFDNPLAGTISTCSIGFNTYDPTKLLANNMESACANRLTVNGSFVGLQMWLLRSFGSLGSRQPAEIFNYVPETWLAQDPSGGVNSNQEYQSIVGLPPIL